MVKALTITDFSTVLFRKTDVILFFAIVFEKKKINCGWAGF